MDTQFTVLVYNFVINNNFLGLIAGIVVGFVGTVVVIVFIIILIWMYRKIHEVSLIL